MANTTADKLAKLNSTKAALKTSINGSGNIVGDVFADYPAAINSGKSAIAAAITEKGVSTSANDTFAQMATNIGEIETGGGKTEGLFLVTPEEWIEGIINQQLSYIYYAQEDVLIPTEILSYVYNANSNQNNVEISLESQTYNASILIYGDYYSGNTGAIGITFEKDGSGIDVYIDFDTMTVSGGDGLEFYLG